MSRAWTGRWPEGLRYGSLGFPLAFAALPLYVILPGHYAGRYGIPLAWLGAMLMATRALDALLDPAIGRWADTLLGRSTRRAWWVAAVFSLLLAAGFHGLFFPPRIGPLHDHPLRLLLWCALWLTLTCLSHSVVSITHQAWGARLGGDEAQRARIVAWREGMALGGVLAASILPSMAGLRVTAATFALLLMAAMGLLWRAPRSDTVERGGPSPANVTGSPLRNAAYRRLLAVYLVNGVASAVPATLVLFFIRDRLQAGAHEPLFLGSYFAAAALSMPLWMQAVKRFGLANAWLIGMGLSITVFGWAAALGPGDVLAFTAVCLLSGVALGADLSLPGALLTGVIQASGSSHRSEGAYLGWWAFASKMNLAVAAGLALPLLQGFGYEPGERGEIAMTALSVVYCVLPCGLKLFAAMLLYRFIQHDSQGGLA